MLHFHTSLYLSAHIHKHKQIHIDNTIFYKAKKANMPTNLCVCKFFIWVMFRRCRRFLLSLSASLLTFILRLLSFLSSNLTKNIRKQKMIYNFNVVHIYPSIAMLLYNLCAHICSCFSLWIYVIFTVVNYCYSCCAWHIIHLTFENNEINWKKEMKKGSTSHFKKLHKWMEFFSALFWWKWIECFLFGYKWI